MASKVIIFFISFVYTLFSIWFISNYISIAETQGCLDCAFSLKFLNFLDKQQIFWSLTIGLPGLLYLSYHLLLGFLFIFLPMKFGLSFFLLPIIVTLSALPEYFI